MPDFSNFIHSALLQTLCSEDWGRSPRHWSCSDTALTDALVEQTRWELLCAAAGGVWGRLRVANTIDTLPRETIENTPPAPEQIQSLLAHGYSLVFNDIQDLSPDIAHLCKWLGNHLFAGVNCNVYLSPQHAQALPRHYDDQDVIVLQLSGQKHWRVYAAANNQHNPLPGVEYSEKLASQGTCLLETTLTSAGALYIPAGFPHEANTTESDSVHLTFSLKTPCNADLIAAVLTQATFAPHDTVQLRGRLPTAWLDKPGPAHGQRALNQTRQILLRMAQALDLAKLQQALQLLSQQQSELTPDPQAPVTTGH
jgi:ribosomal protein L16 Arg81 hydroxylase